MKKDNTVIITSIVGGVILVIALALIFSGSGNKITVEGVASVDAVPDLMTTYFLIETIGGTSSEAKNRNNEIFDELASQFEDRGFDSSELKTQNFNIYPNYEWKNEKQTQNGYKATHSLKFELSSEDFGKISEVIDAGADSGAGISYINFELSQELQNQYKAEALELASQDAEIKADAVAAGFGKKAGRLISVQVSDFDYYPWRLYASDADEGIGVESAELAKQAVTEISPVEQEVTARVSATFNIF